MKEIKLRVIPKLIGVRLKMKYLRNPGGDSFRLRFTAEDQQMIEHMMVFAKKAFKLKLTKGLLIRRALVNLMYEYDEQIRFLRKCQDWEREELLLSERHYLESLSKKPILPDEVLPSLDRFGTFPTFEEREKEKGKRNGRFDIAALLKNASKVTELDEN